jgi:hypothetical protein
MSNKSEGIFSIIGGIGYGIYTLSSRTTSSDYALNAIMSGERGALVFAEAENYGAMQDKFFYINIAISVVAVGMGIYYLLYKKDYYCPHCKTKIQKDVTKCPHCTSDIINQSDSNLSSGSVEKNNSKNSLEKINSFENKIQSEELENPNSPIIIEKKQKSEHLISKLNKLGYKLLTSKITDASEYWEFEFSSNGSKFEISSFEELEKFAKNF